MLFILYGMMFDFYRIWDQKVIIKWNLKKRWTIFSYNPNQTSWLFLFTKKKFYYFFQWHSRSTCPPKWGYGLHRNDSESNKLVCFFFPKYMWWRWWWSITCSLCLLLLRLIEIIIFVYGAFIKLYIHWCSLITDRSINPGPG